MHDGIYMNPWMQTNAPVLQPFTALCDRNAKIEFPKKSFCFTGPARTGPRRKLHDMVASQQGFAYDRVIQGLDYLVIGAQSSPCWAYSTYGRKIEQVLESRRKGNMTVILHEDDLLKQIPAIKSGLELC